MTSTNEANNSSVLTYSVHSPTENNPNTLPTLSYEGFNRVPCFHCQKIFSDNKILSRHLLYFHKDSSSQSSIDCEQFSCPQCGMTFKRKHNYEKHVQTMHQSPKIFACDKCNRTFSSKNRLDRHVHSLHEGLGNCACPVCGKSFTRFTNVQTHIRNIHKELTCSECGEKFFHKSNLRIHQRMKHSKVLVKTSKKSMKAFINQENYIDETQPATCTACKKMFSSLTSLKSHINLAHKGTGYCSCKECGKMFTRKYNLASHIQTAHKDTCVAMSSANGKKRKMNQN